MLLVDALTVALCCFLKIRVSMDAGLSVASGLCNRCCAVVLHEALK